jgi:hypothetical protein
LSFSTAELEEYIKSKWNMDDVDYHYNAVAIIGLPMSGKCKYLLPDLYEFPIANSNNIATLLNDLLGTGFPYSDVYGNVKETKGQHAFYY